MARSHQEPVTVRFYQLAATPLEAALVAIVGKAWERGLHLCLLARDGQQAQRLDDLLWSHSAPLFLPHGLWNAPHPEMQPILISLEPDTRNQATVLVLATPRLVSDPTPFDLLIDFLQGHDATSLHASRSRYRHYRDLGCRMEYWTQTAQGGWKRQDKEATPSTGSS